MALLQGKKYRYHGAHQLGPLVQFLSRVLVRKGRGKHTSDQGPHLTKAALLRCLRQLLTAQLLTSAMVKPLQRRLCT